jgi:Mg-chelatase subunit ChlD
MREVAARVGLGGFSRDLVADLCNMAAGGSIQPPSAYRETVRRQVEEKLPVADSDGEWSVGGGYTKNRQEVVNHRLEKAMRYHQNVCDFLQTVDLSQFPGRTPLEQAMSLLKLLSKQSGGSGGGEGGEPLPIFQNNDRPEGVAEKLHETMELVESLDEVEREMLDPDSNWDADDAEQDGQESGTSGLQALKVAEDLVDGSDKRAMLEISRHLDKFTKLQVRRQKLVQPDPAGDEIRSRPIKHLGELGKVSKSAWATRQEQPTHFLYQAVTGQLPVRERVTRQDKKQAIFILVDGSGSMSGRKHHKATGVVMNRLKAVVAGDAEVWVSVFDTEMSEPSHATNAEEAKELIKKFRSGNFRGGGTDIASAVKAAHAFIEEKLKAGKALWRPEVVVLTDEDSSTEGLRKSEIKGTRVHGFAIERKNPSLVAFAKSTGGVGIENF